MSQSAQGRRGALVMSFCIEYELNVFRQLFYVMFDLNRKTYLTLGWLPKHE